MWPEILADTYRGTTVYMQLHLSQSAKATQSTVPQFFGKGGLIEGATVLPNWHPVH